MPNLISVTNSFTANTKAKSSEVNTNFTDITTGLGGFTKDVKCGTIYNQTSAKSADYTVLDTDGIRSINMTTGGTDRTVTLPTAADNNGRFLTVTKVDSGVGTCLIDGEGAETINDVASILLIDQWDSVTLHCDGTEWFITNQVLGSFEEEQQTSTVNAATTNTYAEICLVTLKSGIWELSACTYLSPNSAAMTAISNMDVGISTQSATTTGFVTPINNIAFTQHTVNAQPNGPVPLTIPLYRVSVGPGTSTTYYLNARCTYTTGQPLWRGVLNARRIAFA